MIKEEYIHEGLSYDISKQDITLDIFLVEYNLAFEFQGEQHYLDNTLFSAQTGAIEGRDQVKKDLCLAAGITLITIPYPCYGCCTTMLLIHSRYWWDQKIPSLAATIKQCAPQINLSYNRGHPIPVHPPLQSAIL